MSAQTDPSPLPAAAFVVLALLAEADSHGYELESQAWKRGFRYWTDVKRSSIYQALRRMLKGGLVSYRIEEGGGPPRKVFAITETGRTRLASDTVAHLSCPDHPRNELDLGLYALPFVSGEEALVALQEGQRTLEARCDFLEERLAWCREQGLVHVALNFERPLLGIRAELAWLQRVEKALADGSLELEALQWGQYQYRQPPEPRVPHAPPPGRKR